jgi:TPP-dependent trihydroxycyclohexane-1,2-dione (THcHDO) dehydratase
MGCAAHRETLEQLADTIDAVRAEEGPSVIVVPVEPYRLLSGTECFWDVGISQASARELVRTLVAAHHKGQQTQRFFGHRPTAGSAER